MYRVYRKNSLSHAAETKRDSRSKYKGGFIVKGNRMNNSKAYNHDYYLQNKDKWKKKNQDTQLNGLLLTFGTIALGALKLAAYAAAITAGIGMVSSFFSTNVSWKSEEAKTSDSKDKKNVDSLNSSNKDAEKKRTALLSENKLFKYKYKITNLLGKVRYFYTTAAYEAYLKHLNKKKEPCTVEEDMAAVNPKVWSNTKDYDQNCAYCTLAYDMRRRGYDVTAISEKNPNYKSPNNDDIETWYEGGKLNTFHISDEDRNSGNTSSRVQTKKLFEELASNGEGSSGFLTMHWSDGGGHAVAWQVINGEAYVIDTQVNKMVTADEFASDPQYGGRVQWGLKNKEKEYAEGGRDYCVNYMRTDNLRPSEKTAVLVSNVGKSEYDEKNDESKLSFGESKPELVDKEEVRRKS